MSDAISAHKLGVRYGDQIALNQVSFDIPRERLVWLVGPNGSGKSTLINALLGLVDHSGTARLLGQPAAKVYHSVGYVPQRFSFDRTIPLTVRELLNLSLDLCGCHVQEKSTAVSDALTAAGAPDLVDRPLSSLSGGQLQRALLARALVHNPQLIILDEPEAGIDRAGESSLYPLLRGLVNEKKLTILLASHELSAARKWADLVIALNGQILSTGRPQEVLGNRTVKEAFRS